MSAPFAENSGVHRVNILQLVREERRLKVNWQRVTVIGFLIAGAVACTILNEPTLATLFAGAAAGAIVPGYPMERNNRNGKD